MVEALSWNTPDLLSFSENNLSSELKKNLTESIDSVNKRQFICIYHRDEFEKVYYSALPKDADIIHVFKYMMTGGGEDKDTQMWLGCYAHAVGFVQSAHAVMDIVSHVIYYAHGGNDGDIFEKLKAKNVTIHTVLKHLVDNGLYSDLVNSIDSLVSMSEFKYLNDLANMIKHRNLVPIRQTSDRSLLPDLSHGMIFKSFEKDGRSYEEQEVSSFFKSTHDPIFSGVVRIGRELNISLELEP